jgi:hypothetical protein
MFFHGPHSSIERNTASFLKRCCPETLLPHAAGINSRTDGWAGDLYICADNFCNGMGRFANCIACGGNSRANSRSSYSTFVMFVLATFLSSCVASASPA